MEALLEGHQKFRLAHWTETISAVLSANFFFPLLRWWPFCGYCPKGPANDAVAVGQIPNLGSKSASSLGEIFFFAAAPPTATHPMKCAPAYFSTAKQARKWETLLFLFLGLGRDSCSFLGRQDWSNYRQNFATAMHRKSPK